MCWEMFLECFRHELTDEARVGWTTYRVRAMMSHIRARFDGGALEKSEGSMLSDVYKIMASGAKTVSKRARRVQRIGDRPNPFIFFRGAANPESPEHDDEQEDVRVVAKYFVPCEYVAKMILPYGATTLPDFYKEGRNSFAVA